MRFVKYVGIIFLACILWRCGEEDVFLSISSHELTFDWTGEQIETIKISSNAEWDVSVIPAWLMFRIVNDAEESVVYISAKKNTTDTSRICCISFLAPDCEETLWVTQRAKEVLEFSLERDTVSFSDSELVVEIENNIQYGVHVSEEWLGVVKRNNTSVGINAYTEPRFTLKIDANTSREEREAKVVVSNEKCGLFDTLTIVQAGNPWEFYADGACVQWQQADYSGGVNLVFMGDGFTWENLAVGGTYECCLKEAVEHFFSIEPYKTYRNCFNVYMVAVVSEEVGVGNSSQLGKVGNKFGSVYGMGTAITCDSDLVFEYARKVEGLPEDKPLTVVLVLNDDKYAGTALLYADGNAIALCPMSAEAAPNDFEGVVHHEAGGHAFGFLCDEYVYYPEVIPKSRKREVRAWQELGFQMNLDFTGDASAVLWKEFIGRRGYEEAGVYEGGFEYQYGVWRSEENSCMNNNVPYYNVQSRWSIVQRIMQLSGRTCSVEEFMAKDVAEPPVAASKARPAQGFVPLGEPQWIWDAAPHKAGGD